MPLSLPNVTLLCADTRTPSLAAYAIGRCQEIAQFAETVFLGEAKDFEHIGLPSGIRCVTVPKMSSISDYSRLMIHGLKGCVRTSHVLVVQWDGFVSSPELWSNDYLAYDYVGPPWYHGGHPGMVGNGGFSLRSARLIAALSAFQFNPEIPEDMAICVDFRSRLESEMGIRFAPLEVAQKFGHEYGDYRPSFGFHGMHNFAHVMTDAELTSWLAMAPAEITGSKHARKLIKELMTTQRYELASKLIAARSEVLGCTIDLQMLWLRNFARRVMGEAVLNP